MLKLPLLGAWNSASSSPMIALLSISRTRLGVCGDPGLWHYCEGFWCLMLALDLRCKHTGWSTWPAPPPGSTGHLVLSPTMTAMSADLAGRLEFSPCSVLSPVILFWGHSTQSGCVLLQCGVSPLGALALESLLLSGAQLGWVLLACFPPAPQTEAKRTAWVREVLGPELLPSDDTALLIFSLVTFLCITWDTPRWAARNPLSPHSHLLQVENHQNGEFQHGVFILSLSLSLSLLWNVEVIEKRFLLSWHFCCFCPHFLILSRSLQDIQGSIYSRLLA